MTKAKTIELSPKQMAELFYEHVVKDNAVNFTALATAINNHFNRTTKRR